MSQELQTQQKGSASIGMQAQFQRDASGSGHAMPDYLFGVYLHHDYSPVLSGEFGVSIGTLSGRDFKSRRIPVEYRLNLGLNPLFSSSGQMRETVPFLYAGFGWMLHQPLEVPSSGDPLTPTQGSAVGATPLWVYESGVTPFLPVGAGATRRLSPTASLDARFGYHIPLELDALSRGTKLDRGYWGFTLGLRFRTQQVGRPAETLAPPVVRTPAPVMEPVISPLPAEPPKPVREFPVGKVERLRIHFDLNRIELDDTGRERADWLAGELLAFPDVRLMITGHTDALGADPVNEFLSLARARAVWLHLVDRGVSPDRIIWRGLADGMPLEQTDDETPSRLNRRVDFQLAGPGDETGGIGDMATPEHNPARIAAYMPGEPLFGRHLIVFRHFSAEPAEGTMAYLAAARDLLRDRDRLSLIILARDDSYERGEYREAVPRARAEWVRAWLILQGIAPHRVEVVGHQDPRIREAGWSRWLHGDQTQQMILIPVSD